MKGFLWAFAKFAALALAFVYFKNELEPVTQILFLCGANLAIVYTMYDQTANLKKKIEGLEDTVQKLRLTLGGSRYED